MRILTVLAALFITLSSIAAEPLTPDKVSLIDADPAPVEDCRMNLQCWAAKQAPAAVPVCRKTIIEAVKSFRSPFTGISFTHRKGSTFKYIGWSDKSTGAVWYAGT